MFEVKKWNHVIERFYAVESLRLRKANHVAQSIVFLPSVLRAYQIYLSIKLLLHNYLGNVGLKNAFLSSVSASRLEKLFRFSKPRKFGIVITKIFFFKKYKVLTLYMTEVDYKCHWFLGLSVFCLDI